MDAKTVDRRAQHQPRLEDDPLVRGLGRYAADAPLTGQTYAYFVRSPHAFADIRSIDTEAAKAVPGVLAVLTAADMDGDRQHLPAPAARRAAAARSSSFRIAPRSPARPCAMWARRSRSWSPRRSRPRRTPPRLVVVDYEERTPVVDLREAVRDGAPQVWPEAPGNIAVDWPGPAKDPDANAQEVDAHHRIRQARGARLAGPSAHPGAVDGAARRHRELRSCR